MGSGASLVNSTCTISGSSIKTIYAGNGAFIAGVNQLTGFDGISGDVDAIVLFDQACDENGCDNSTCWDASIACTDNGAASSDVMFMETVNNAGQNGGVINLPTSPLLVVPSAQKAPTMVLSPSLPVKTSVTFSKFLSTSLMVLSIFSNQQSPQHKFDTR